MKIEKENVVSMFYELKDGSTGEVLESNLNEEPVVFLIGKGQMLEALEEKLLGSEVPSNIELDIPCSEALGEYDEGAIEVLPKEQFAGIDLKLGMELFGEGEDGSTVRVIVKDITDDKVSVDYNHPYAGKDLKFLLNLLEVRQATQDELLTGVVANPSKCGCGGGGHGHDHGGHDHGHGGCGGKGGGCCGGH